MTVDSGNSDVVAASVDVSVVCEVAVLLGELVVAVAPAVVLVMTVEPVLDVVPSVALV